MVGTRVYRRRLRELLSGRRGVVWLSGLRSRLGLVASNYLILTVFDRETVVQYVEYMYVYVSP